MAYSERARQFAADEMQRRRNAAGEQTERRRAEAYQKVPALLDLDREISDLGVSALRMMLKEGHSTDDYLAPRIRELKEKRERLLTAAGLPADSLDEVHLCPVCFDRGYLQDGSLCGCYKKLLQDFSLNEIRTVSPLTLCSFDSFSLDYYPTVKNEEFGLSARENMTDTLRRCRDFAARFPDCPKSLLLLGDAGLGKTHLALSIANEVLARGYDVVYASAPSVLKQVEREQFEEGRDTTTLDSLKRCELLVLDDLGAEYINSFIVSVLYDLINTRMVANRPTIYTTNITNEDQISIRYTEKVASRLLGSCTVLPFFGDDIRMLKG